MKKKLLVAGAAALLSTTALAFSGTVELGYEHEIFPLAENTTYARGDALTPYIGLNVRPFPGNSLRVEAKYSYNHQYNKDKETSVNSQFKTKRDRYEMFFSGYQYKNGNYTFSPKVGFRYDNFDINYNNSSSQVKSMMNYRFYPNMTYKINNQFSLYMSGHVGGQTFQTRQRGRAETASSKDAWGVNGKRTYTDNYFHELEVIGLRYFIPGTKHSVGTSIFWEKGNQEYVQRYDRWQARLFGSYVLNDKITLGAYVRQDLDYEQKNLARGNDFDKTRDRQSTRIAVTAAYKIRPTTTLGTEVYWNTEKQPNWNNTNAINTQNRDKWYYKLYVRQAF